MNFLSYIIFPERVEMNQEKIRTDVEWEAPDSVKGVQSFLRFANFYWRFIEGYSKLTCPITHLTKGRSNSSGQMNVGALLGN